MKDRCGALTIAVALGVLGLSPAAAATCSAQSDGVAFGDYNSLSPVALDGAGTITIECDSDTPFSVQLGTGTGSYEQRLMMGSGSRLAYNLYVGPSRMIVWGDGTTGADVSTHGTRVDVPVYGRIGARQAVAAGVYVDQITVTISY